jgi:methyl-accepting chemotaxis protein
MNGLARRTTIRARLLSGIGVPLLALIATGIISVWALSAVQRDITAGVAGSTEISSLVSRSQAAMLRYATQAQGALLGDAGGQRTVAAERFSAESDSLRRAALSRPDLATEDRKLLEQVGTLQGRLEVYLAVARAWQELGRADAATRQSSLAAATLDTLLNEAEKLATGQEEMRIATIDEIGNLVASRRAVLLAILFVGILAALVLGYRTWQAATKPLERLARAAQKLGEGDLRVDATDVSDAGLDAEYAVMANALSMMADRLRAIVSDLRTEVAEIARASEALTSASEQAASSTGEISTAMTGIATEAETQRRSFEQSGTALRQVFDSAAELGEIASRARSASVQITSTSERTREDIRGALDALERAQSVIQESRDAIARLETASEDVERFVDTVGRIADQTNLLALNAAIEAARAGESGRGFAVVAEEVRRLARQAEQASAEVSAVVTSMRGQVSAAVRSFGKGAATLGDVGSVSHRAVSALEAIADSVGGIDELANSVGAAAQSHGAAVTDLVERLGTAGERTEAQAASSEEAAAAAEQTAASAEEVAATAHKLASNAARLQALTEGLRV